TVNAQINSNRPTTSVHGKLKLSLPRLKLSAKRSCFGRIITISDSSFQFLCFLKHLNFHRNNSGAPEQRKTNAFTRGGGEIIRKVQRFACPGQILERPLVNRFLDAVLSYKLSDI